MNKTNDFIQIVGDVVSEHFVHKATFRLLLLLLLLLIIIIIIIMIIIIIIIIIIVIIIIIIKFINIPIYYYSGCLNGMTKVPPFLPVQNLQPMFVSIEFLMP